MGLPLASVRLSRGVPWWTCPPLFDAYRRGRTETKIILACGAGKGGLNGEGGGRGSVDKSLDFGLCLAPYSTKQKAQKVQCSQHARQVGLV